MNLIKAKLKNIVKVKQKREAIHMLKIETAESEVLEENDFQKLKFWNVKLTNLQSGILKVIEKYLEQFGWSYYKPSSSLARITYFEGALCHLNNPLLYRLDVK